LEDDHNGRRPVWTSDPAFGYNPDGSLPLGISPWSPKLMKLKLGIVVVIACAVALAFVFQGGLADPLAAGDDSQTQWMCKSCSHCFLLTARQVAQRADRDPRRWAPLDCPQCGRKQAYLALACPKCQTIYFGQDVPGELGQCPRCATGRRMAVAEEDRPSAELSSRQDGSAARPRPAAKVR